MKKVIVIIFIGIIFNIGMTSVEAEECPSEGVIFYKTLGDKVTFTPNVVYIDDTSFTFEMIISDLSEELSIYNETNENYIDTYVLPISDLVGEDDESYTYIIYTNSNSGCPGLTVATRHIKFPNFNSNSLFNFCEGKVEYDICKTWYPYDVSANKARNIVNSYDVSKASELDDKKTTLFNKFINFVLNYQYVLIGVLIVIIGVIIIITIKHRKEDIV